MDLKFQGEGAEWGWGMGGEQLPENHRVFHPVIKSGVLKGQIKVFTISLQANYPAIMMDPPVEPLNI